MSAPIYITVPENYLDDMASKVVVDVASPAPSRKRRLDHLTWEEKMQRKKLKNRVAAQTSRDRKKAKMDDMEYRIKNLEEKNERLCEELDKLRETNERLSEENQLLRKESVARAVAGSHGPAASPLQKGGPLSAGRATLLAMWLLSQISSTTSTQTTTSIPSTSSLTPSSRRLVQLLQERLKMSQSGTLESVLKQLKWWGPQQSNWNPVEVTS